jgi:hypothetical protein
MKSVANIYVIIDSLKEIMETGRRFLAMNYPKAQETTNTIICLIGT